MKWSITLWIVTKSLHLLPSPDLPRMHSRHTVQSRGRAGTARALPVTYMNPTAQDTVSNM